MTKELSIKNWIVILMGGDRFFITEKEAGVIKNGLKNGDKFIELENIFFASNQFARLINGGDYQEAERIRRGDYKCSNCGNWIPYKKSCGICG